MKYLSICAIVRNEAQYIEEWIEFHRLQGVEHFFLYENESTDYTWEILEHYKDLGIATIEQVKSGSDNSPQLATYRKCLKDHGHKSKWIAFLDCDEFLLSKKELLNVKLKEYEAHPAVAVNWVFYGSNGQKTKTQGLVIERFPMRDKHANQHVKSIVQPALTVTTGNNAHYFKLKGRAVDENKDWEPEVYHWTEPSIEIFRINHYHTKSKEEYFARKSRLDVDGVDRGNTEERFKVHDRNDIEDGFSKEFINKVKSNIRKVNLEYVWNRLEPKPWQVKEEFIMFLEFILKHELNNILEIGCFKGGSASAFLEIGCAVTCVDIEKQPEISKLEGGSAFNFFYRDELESSQRLLPQNYDLLFIDGDHSYEGCKKDYEDYKSYVKPGGYIAFHDSVKSDLHKTQECEVWRFIEELNPRNRIEFITEGNWGGITIIKIGEYESNRSKAL